MKVDRRCCDEKWTWCSKTVDTSWNPAKCALEHNVTAQLGTMWGWIKACSQQYAEQALQKQSQIRLIQAGSSPAWHVFTMNPGQKQAAFPSQSHP